jgi:ADP-heptose:LPS heptosyltransferase
MLAARLKGANLIMVGAPEEAASSASCAQQWQGPLLNLCARASVRVAGAVMRGSTVFVGQDSGPTHLAAVVGVPCVGIYSARNLPGHWWPRGRQNRVLQKKVECAGCQLDTCIERKKICLSMISVDEVAKHVLEIIHQRTR